MTLLITEEYRKELDPDNYCIKASMMIEKGVHLFIASNKWDLIKVELCPALIADTLAFLPKVCSNIQINRVPNYMPYVNHLIALYPNKSGSLRRCQLAATDAYEPIKEYIYE